MFARLLPLAALLAGVLAAPAAQAVPMEPYPMIEFRGTITASAADTLTVNLPDGTTGPWTGPLPAYPYQVGDEFVVSFGFGDGAFPPDEFFVPPGGPVPDVIRYPIVGEQGLRQRGEIGAARTSLDISGPMTEPWSLISSGMALAYDTTTGQFALEFDRGGDWSFGFVDGPTYAYNLDTGDFELIDSTRGIRLEGDPPSACEDDIYNYCFTMNGFTAADGTTAGAVDRIVVTGSDKLGLLGSFGLAYEGSWFFNGERYGEPTQVPEPGAFGLFALAIGAIALRRRRKRALAA